MESDSTPRRAGRGLHPRPGPARSKEGVPGLLAKGLAAFAREDEETAIEYFLDALEVAPGNLRLHFLAALCAHLLSDEETVENVCASALEIDERHPYAIACEAARFTFLANYSRAEALYEQALRLLPDDVDLLIGLGILHEYAGEEEKGVNTFERALELDPDNVRARLSLGIAYAMSGEYESAYEQYARAKLVDPEIENPHQRLGRDYYLEGMTDEAAGEFAVAVGEEPDQPGAWFYLMDCHRRHGRFDDALDCFEEIKRRFGGDPDTAAGYYEYFQMHPEAIAALEELCRRNSEDADCRYRLSTQYQQAGRIDDAIAAARDAADRDPGLFNALELLAKLQFERGDYRASAATARKALEVSPTCQGAAKTLADALVYLGQGDAAQKVVEEMEATRDAAWKRYQDRFSGQDRAGG
jgi:pentatricopeptide repeat protein